MYLLSIVILTGGFGYSVVPLYRLFCQTTGFGGTINTSHDTSKMETMKPVRNRKINITFMGTVYSGLPWKFKSSQTSLKVIPGETVLAFYKAKNISDKPLVGIATYNVVPYESAPYFTKIQCFCFEEQRLNPHEEVDMPVFFYIDPEYAEDPKLEFCDEIMLSYTFFEAKEGVVIPNPFDQSNKQIMPA